MSCQEQKWWKEKRLTEIFARIDTRQIHCFAHTCIKISKVSNRK